MAYLHLINDSDQHQESRVPGTLDEVASAYMPLIRHVVNRVVAGATRSVILDYEDLISCGMQGLIEAYHAYDDSRGVKFSTYALPRIRGSILDALRAAHPLPRSLQKVSSAVDKATYQLSMDLGRSPSRMEVANRLGMTAFELMRASKLTNMKTLSLENLAEISGSGGAEKLIALADDDVGIKPDAVVEQRITREHLIAAIGELPDRERQIIVFYYLESRSLKSIGRALKVSESRVSQLRHRAVRRLRESLALELSEAA